MRNADEEGASLVMSLFSDQCEEYLVGEATSSALSQKPSACRLLPASVRRYLI